VGQHPNIAGISLPMFRRRVEFCAFSQNGDNSILLYVLCLIGDYR
jgi:hypothetical protein